MKFTCGSRRGPRVRDKGDTRAQYHLHHRLQPDGRHAEVHSDRAEHVIIRMLNELLKK